MSATTPAAVAEEATALCRPGTASWPHLAGLHARCFAQEASTRALLPLPGLAAAVLWLVVLGILVAGFGVTDPAASALALAAPSRPSLGEILRAAGAGMLGALGILGVALGVGASPLASPPWAYATLAVLGAIVAPAGLNCLRGRTARAALRAARPGEPHLFVSGLCRARGAPGAGAELMVALCQDADARARVLALDAIAPALVAYYARFGFTVTGPAQVLPGGAVVTPMARAPRGDPR